MLPIYYYQMYNSTLGLPLHHRTKPHLSYYRGSCGGVQRPSCEKRKKEKKEGDPATAGFHKKKYNQ